MKTPLITTVLAATLTLAQVGTARATVIVDTTFSSGKRTIQNPPNELQWFSSNAPEYVAASPGSLQVRPGALGSQLMTLAYFTVSGNPLSLAEGEILTLTYTFNLPDGDGKSSGQGFRMGLFDSKGKRIDTDGATGSNPLYKGYTGYSVMTNLNSTSSTGTSIQARSNIQSQSLISTGSDYTSLAQGTALSLKKAVSYTGILTIQNNGDAGVYITNTFSGGDLLGETISYTDTAYKYASFDTIVFLVNNAAAATFELTSLSIDVAPIPEPTVSGLALVISCLFIPVGILRRAMNQ